MLVEEELVFYINKTPDNLLSPKSSATNWNNTKWIQ